MLGALQPQGTGNDGRMVYMDDMTGHFVYADGTPWNEVGSLGNPSQAQGYSPQIEAPAPPPQVTTVKQTAAASINDMSTSVSMGSQPVVTYTPSSLQVAIGDPAALHITGLQPGDVVGYATDPVNGPVYRLGIADVYGAFDYGVTVQGPARQVHNYLFVNGNDIADYVLNIYDPNASFTSNDVQYLAPYPAPNGSGVIGLPSIYTPSPDGSLMSARVLGFPLPVVAGVAAAILYLRR